MNHSNVTAIDPSVNSTVDDSQVIKRLWYLMEICAPAPYAYVFYYGVKVFNLAIGTPLNLMVMWQIIRSKKSDTSTSDIFILNLAILDAYFCLMTPIDMVNRMVLNNDGLWYFQHFAYGVKDTAPLFLVCICMDRYVAVVHPVLFTGIRDNKVRTFVSLLTWGLILAYGLTKSILGVMSVNEIFSGLILFSFALMIFCNISIIWVLRRSVTGKEVMHPVKKKALKMVLTLLGIIILNYLPPVALMPFYSYFTLAQFRCQVAPSVFSIMDLSSSIEPLLYVTKMDRPAWMGEGLCCGLFAPVKKTEDMKL